MSGWNVPQEQGPGHRRSDDLGLQDLRTTTWTRASRPARPCASCRARGRSRTSSRATAFTRQDQPRHRPGPGRRQRQDRIAGRRPRLGRQPRRRQGRRQGGRRRQLPHLHDRSGPAGGPGQEPRPAPDQQGRLRVPDVAERSAHQPVERRPGEGDEPRRRPRRVRASTTRSPRTSRAFDHRRPDGRRQALDATANTWQTIVFKDQMAQ